MESGIVYFDEIVENIKDATGIDNARPLYAKIRRFVYNCEIDIGAGGVIVLKKKEYTIGDGFYDGNSIVLPEDFVSEWSYGSFCDGVKQGNLFRLKRKGQTQIDFRYLGFLLDETGNPFTTRNRLPAVVSYAIYKLYSSKYFVGSGNQNQYMLYKLEYEDNVMAARGNDAFPSEEEWKELGATRLGGAFEAMTDCGMKYIDFGENDPSTIDTTLPKPEASCTAFMDGIIYGWSTVTGTISFYAVIQISGTSNGSTNVTGTLIGYINALIGASNGSSNVTGILIGITNVIIGVSNGSANVVGLLSGIMLPLCIQYFAEAGLVISELEWTDCNGVEQNQVFDPNGTAIFCAEQGSVSLVGGDITVSILGPC